MTSDRKDVLGLGGLVNPTYASPQSVSIEQHFLSGASASADTAEQAQESSAEILQHRFDEIEKRLGVPVFEQSAPREETHDRSEMPARASEADDDFGASADEPSVSTSSERAKPSFTMSNEGFRHTEEAQKRDRLNSALSALSIGVDGFLDADRERDRKLMMIEEIEDLVTLFRDDEEDVSHIRVPTVDDPFETIQGTLTILKRHNDRRRFGTLADEVIMLAASSLETLCDGEREWVGFRPDLRGWSSHVRAKLRRMHHDTSQIASSIMNDFNIGPGTRLFIELVPNLIMYARDRSTKGASAASSAPTRAPTDAEFGSAVDRLRSK